MIECRLIDTEEIIERTEAGARQGDAAMLIEPGMMWFVPWIFDHQDPDLEQYLPQLIKDARVRRNRNSTSIQYLQDWAKKRDPLCIMLPHVGLFYPDSAEPNSKGWRVTGIAPRITIHNEIVYKQAVRLKVIDGRITLTGYHSK